MEIRNGIAIGQTTANDSTKTNNRGSLSTEDFLQIMAAEISNQNPMGGSGGSGSNTDYISQMAQFSVLDEMSKISDSLNILTLMGQQQYAFSLMGKEVTLSDGEGNNITGNVEKVKFEGGYGIIQVQGKDYYLGSIVEVSNPEVNK